MFYLVKIYINSVALFSGIEIVFGIHNHDKRQQQYVVIGGSIEYGGIGNSLIAYPSVYFFVILSNRSIVIQDHSELVVSVKFSTAASHTSRLS